MNRFKNIMYFANGDVDVSPALKRAVSLAESNQARLTVFDVLEPTDTPVDMQDRFEIDLDRVLQARRQDELEGLVAALHGPEAPVYLQVQSGKPFLEVIRAVKRNAFDLVIKEAWPLQGVSDRLFGSTDMHLLRKCPCPVWIDRPQAAHPYRTVLAAVDPVGVDDRGCARLVMDLATSLAQRESARLAVAHTWRLDGETILREGRASVPATKFAQLLEQTEQYHREHLDALLADYPLRAGEVDVHLLKGDPAPSLRALSQELKADLIVMGTVGRTGIPGLFIGNTAEELLQTSQASILAVKPQGFRSPVEAA